MTTYYNRIIIEHSIRKRIKEDLNTSYPTIRSALLGITNTEKSRAIRKKALELGGIELTTR